MSRGETEAGHGRLLDAWSPPDDAGSPVGCIATTFQLDPELFEEHCLAAFAGVERHPRDEGALYLIDREEKFSALECASVLVDAYHCRGPRSLHWDMIPVRVPRAIQHAKVSLLLWQRRARLIVGSANLTQPGYRREAAGPRDRDAARRRWHALLDRVERDAAGWGSQGVPRGRQGVRVYPVLTGPGRPDALTQLRAIFPGKARKAWIVSPFFDPPETPNEPSRRVWDLLARRGEAEAIYLLEAEQVPGEQALVVRAPETIRHQPAGRPLRLALRRLAPSQDDAARPLHMKSLWLEGGGWHAYLIGSSNFTTRGLGLGAQNLEANLVYLVHAPTEKRSFRELKSAFPESDEIPGDAELRWESRPAEDEDEEADGTWFALSPFFAEAAFQRDAGGAAALELRFDPDAGEPSPDWSLRVQDRDVLDAARWQAGGRPHSWRIPWPDDLAPPGGLDVHRSDDRRGWWPVTRAAGAVLPTPDELRRLTLDELIAVLTSARPLHEAYARLRRRQIAEPPGSEAQPMIEVDPHARVRRDAERFLLRRIRRLSWALEGLRKRLERPVATHAALRWRLHGPVGARRLGELLFRAAQSPAESAFLRAELALELARVRPIDCPGSIPAAEVRAEIRALIAELRDGKSFVAEVDMAAYVDAAFAEALR